MKNLLLNLVNHERYQVIFAIVACTAAMWFFGCESEVTSIMHPDEKVCRDELEAELGLVLSSYEKRFRELDRLDQFKELAFQQAQSTAAGNPLNVPGLIGTLAAIFGVGAVIDNTRKRTEIKKLRETLSTNSA